MEAQRGEVTRPKAHSPEGWELRLCQDPAPGPGVEFGSVLRLWVWAGACCLRGRLVVGVGRAVVTAPVLIWFPHWQNSISSWQENGGWGVMGVEGTGVRSRAPVTRASHCCGEGQELAFARRQ